MTKLKIYEKTVLLPCLLFVVFLLLALFFAYISFSGIIGTPDIGTCLVLLPFVIVLGIILFLIKQNLSEDTEYISEVNIYDDSITVVHKIKTDVSRVQEVKIADLSQVKTSVDVGKYVSYSIEFLCKEQEKSVVILYDSLIDMSVRWNLHFIFYKLFDIKETLPNFSCEINGTNLQAVKDLQNYYATGKHIKSKSNIFKILAIVLIAFCPLILPLLVYFFTYAYPQMMQNSLSVDENKYIEYVSAGYECYRKSNYACAKENYDNAENIVKNDNTLYLYKAYLAYSQKDYKSVIAECNKAEQYLNQKSVYDRGHGLVLLGKSHNAAAIYDNRAQAYYELKDYQNAIKDFDKELSESSYAYTEAYYRRGFAKYYSADYQGALIDFQKHEKILEKYFSEMSGVRYPQYTQKDMANTKTMIKYCQIQLGR